MTAPWSRSTLQPCGTNAAYARHRRRGEDPDQACRDANRAYKRQRYRDPDLVMHRARAEALEALSHRHPEEFRRLYAAALTEVRAQVTADVGAGSTGADHG